MIVKKAPEKYEIKQGQISIFLAGSIEMGKAEDWQTKVTEKFKPYDVLILNPRRDDWDCVDSDTKSITRNGIKSFDQIKIGDEILTLNVETKKLEYQPVTKMNVYRDFDSEMQVFQRNNDSFYFTNNHRFISRKASRDDSFGVYTCESFVGKKDHVRIPCGHTVAENALLKREGIIPEGNQWLDDHFKLAAWILSEGSIFTRKSTGYPQVTIAQYKKNHIKVKEIFGILDRLGMNYCFSEPNIKLDQDSVDFVVGIMELEKYKIPTWIKNASPEQKAAFIIEYGKGDGSFVNGELRYVAFSAKYRVFAEEFQILCYEAGLSSKLREKTSGFGHDVINVCIHNKNKKWYTMKHSKTDISQQKQTVWCPTTKNGTWIAYRNGSPFVTGNSSWEQSIDNKQFNEQVTWELKAQEDADIIIMNFCADTKSPITLLELGLFAKTGKVRVSCPDEFWRKGNVEMCCDRYNIPLYDNLDLMTDNVIEEVYARTSINKEGAE